MYLAIVTTRANVGIDAPEVRVEVHLSNGLPAFNIVGLPEAAVRESRERVRSALLTSQLDFPDRRITVNLAPADLPKSGGRYDLAIAVGILAASGQLPADRLDGIEFLGELALTGELREVCAPLPAVMAAKQASRQIVIPPGNSREAGLIRDSRALTAGHLLDVVGYLQNAKGLEAVKATPPARPRFRGDLEDVVGQFTARRALVIAAAGGHNLLMSGPPGTGKTMLASRLCSILPPMDEESALASAAIRSLATSGFEPAYWRVPPFRAPHHTASAVALVGGGSSLKVGEISLAHNGVLFLDELPEFSPRVLEVLREPMESGSISISRASYQVRLPARFQLVAAMNPCPCGYLGDAETACRCSPEKVQKYQSRVSGPLLDRFDIHVVVPRLSEEEKEQLLTSRKRPQDSSATARARVTTARGRQLARAGKSNAALGPAEIREHCCLEEADERFLKDAAGKLGLSTRGFFRVLKLSRTIADLEDAKKVSRPHLAEAIGLRFPASANPAG